MSFEALNMHTDLKVSVNGDGSVTITGKDKHGHEHSITVSAEVARKIHETAGGRMHANGTHHHGVTPFNMHTDVQVRRNGGSAIVVTGTASKAGNGDGQLTVTIDGPAFDELKAANVGL